MIFDKFEADKFWNEAVENDIVEQEFKDMFIRERGRTRMTTFMALIIIFLVFIIYQFLFLPLL